jgi:transposase-like protein
VKTKETYGLYAHSHRFDTNEKCQAFLMEIRWNGIPTCNACGNHHMNYYLKTRRVYKCSECYKQFSITQGTIFEKSKIPLTKWFLAIYIFTTMKRGISSCQLAKMLTIQQRSAWFILQRLRLALKDENENILNGIVEADEAFIGPKIGRDKRLQKAKKIYDAEQERIHGLSERKARRLLGPRKGTRPKGHTKEVIEQKRIEKELRGERTSFERITVVFGMMERNGKIIMKKLGKSAKDVNRSNIHPLLKKHISNGSTLVTDEAFVYTEIKFLKHLSVNHKKCYVTEEGVHTNSIENAWKHFRKVIEGTYFHMSYKHFDHYLNENTYRWNRRKESEKFLFEDFIPLIEGKKITYRKLIAANKLAA